MALVELLQGQEVTRVCLDYALTLLGDKGDEIQVQTRLDYVGADGTRVSIDPEDAKASAQLIDLLLRQTVRECEVGQDGSLRLSFESGSQVEVRPDPDYEAWTTASPDGSKLVCLPGGKVARWPALDVGADDKA